MADKSLLAGNQSSVVDPPVVERRETDPLYGKGDPALDETVDTFPGEPVEATYEPTKVDRALARYDQHLDPFLARVDHIGVVAGSDLHAFARTLRHALAAALGLEPEVVENPGESLDMLGEQRKAAIEEQRAFAVADAAARAKKLEEDRAAAGLSPRPEPLVGDELRPVREPAPATEREKLFA
jgi:hypothetical protein